jgi:hypothetical protein
MAWHTLDPFLLSGFDLVANVVYRRRKAKGHVLFRETDGSSPSTDGQDLPLFGSEI